MAVRHFTRNPVTYAHTRGALLWHLLFSAGKLRNLQRPECSWDGLLDAINGFHDGFFQTLQVRSEITSAMRIFEKHKPRVILEIGTAHAGTFFLLSRAAAPDALLISLDLPGGRYGGGYSQWKTPVYRRLLRRGQGGVFLRGNSHERAFFERVRKVLDGRAIDLLFIDGDHTYQGVRQDYEMYSTLVREGGLIAFHDVARHPEKSGCGVDRLWNEIKHGAEFREIIEDPHQGWAGIGILWKARGPVRRAARR